MPVIPVHRVVDTKRIIVKTEARGGRKAQGAAHQKNNSVHIKQALEIVIF
jgi:hypothetical protein